MPVPPVPEYRPEMLYSPVRPQSLFSFIPFHNRRRRHTAHDEEASIHSFSPAQFQPARRDGDENYGEEWKKMYEELQKHDKGVVKDYFTEIDTLLVFVRAINFVIGGLGAH